MKVLENLSAYDRWTGHDCRIPKTVEVLYSVCCGGVVVLKNYLLGPMDESLMQTLFNPARCSEQRCSRAGDLSFLRKRSSPPSSARMISDSLETENGKRNNKGKHARFEPGISKSLQKFTFYPNIAAHKLLDFVLHKSLLP